jgi:hypothetical protein
VQVEMANVLNASSCIACRMCSDSVLWCLPSRLAYRICTVLLNTAWMHTGILNVRNIVYGTFEKPVLGLQKFYCVTFMHICSNLTLTLFFKNHIVTSHSLLMWHNGMCYFRYEYHRNAC